MMVMELIGYNVDIRKANKFTYGQFNGCDRAEGKCGSFECNSEEYFCT